MSVPKWYELPLAVIDFESTGFRAPVRICEIGVVRYERGVEVARLECLVNPQRPIEPGAAKVHGLTNETVAASPTFRERLPHLTEILAGAAPVAYGTFDRRALHEELANLRRYGVHVDERIPAYSSRWEKWLDVLEWMRVLHPVKGKGMHTLEAMAKVHGIPFGNGTTAHRAIDDAMVTGELLWKNREKLPNTSLSKLLAGDHSDDFRDD